ncbi:hypothetical protein O181_030500 [Austropuccinia psidii MF-1]|uniref:Uncharacterized protein n=1 Tax=Austropuccinia psidii MF-1 TaxID=1389203 RepID=A0A9Q3CWC3_9BASI|nr:hypothetical protein [Austropuccinia psidii MF-1]
MEIDRRKNFKFSKWAPETGTPDCEDNESEGTETPIWGISSSELQNESFSAVKKTYAKKNSVAHWCNSFNKNTGTRTGIPARGTLVEGL